MVSPRLKPKKTTAQPAKTPDYAAIGEMLHDTRASYNLSIEQVSSALRMKTSVIEALEKGALDEVAGGAVYAKGHLRTDAQYLGVNLNTMLDLLTIEAEVKPLASVSPSHNEPLRTQVAVILSVVVMLAFAAVWYIDAPEHTPKEVSLIKPLPDELSVYLGAEDDMGLSSPCIHQEGYGKWPSCFGVADMELMEHLQPEKARSVMELHQRDFTMGVR